MHTKGVASARSSLIAVVAVIFLLGIVGDSFAQRRGFGGGGFRSTPNSSFRSAPPRPMTPTMRPMQPSAPRTTTVPRTTPAARSGGGTSPQFNSASRGVSTGSARALPSKLASAPIAQVRSFQGSVTQKGLPIVVAKSGAKYSVPAKGMFSTKVASAFKYVKTDHTRYFADGRVAKLQTRIATLTSNAKKSTGNTVVGKTSEKSEATNSSKLLWTSWDKYAKKTYRGKEYAEVGGRLYTKHAIDRMQPSGSRGSVGKTTSDSSGRQASGKNMGRSMPPSFVEDVIKNGTRQKVIDNGVERVIHSSGTAEVVTEDNEKIVVTVNPFRGK